MKQSPLKVKLPPLKVKRPLPEVHYDTPVGKECPICGSDVVSWYNIFHRIFGGSKIGCISKFCENYQKEIK